MKSSTVILCLLVASAPAITPPAATASRSAPRPSLITAPQEQPYPGVIVLEVDATDVDRRIFQVRETIPVTKSGPMKLLFPQWLPGKHAPRSNVKDLTGLVVKANGALVPWTRDSVNMFAYHLVVPQGAKALELTFQTVTPTTERQGRIVMSREMVNVQFDALALYPAGYASRRVPIKARLHLPEGWKFGTALEVASQEGDVTQFRTTDLETLVDSPIFAGRNYRLFDLDPQGRSPVRLHVVADSPEQLEATPDQIELHRNLLRQADKLFGARHFDHYDFLLALTERMGAVGLEHHRSSENATTPTYFIE